MHYTRFILGILAAQRRWLCAVITLLLGLAVSPWSMADARDDIFRAAKMDNKFEMISLLKRGVSPNLIEPVRGESVLILAVREESMAVLPILLNANGIKLDIRAKNGDTALMIAAYKKNKPAVEALLAKGAQVNNDGWTALHYAAAVGETEIVQLLLKKSAEVNAKSPNKTTPMMMAAGGGFIYTVKALLDAGADSKLENEQELTAIDFAEKGGHKDIVEGLSYRQKKAEKRATEVRVEKAKQNRPLIINTRLPPME